MHKILFLFLFLQAIQCDLFAQKTMAWEDFTDVTFSDYYSPEYGEVFLKPKFGPTIQSHKGKRLRIKGYFLDFSIEEQEFYMISKNPQSSCFFCGGAGPESVIEVVFKQKPKFKTDQVVEIIGVLDLNVDDVEHCNYILKEATGKLIQ